MTPLLENSLLNKRMGGRVLLKLETLQHTGSFKYRGALNRLLQLSPEQRRAGVVAFSSGNHAQGVASAAQALGIPAIILMPSDAPAIKVTNTKGYGAEVRHFDRWKESREAIAAGIARERGAVLVPPYDDADIIAGQGTAGLELCAQAHALGAVPDSVVVCCSGGGLVAGIALAVEAESPATKVYTAEPAGFDDHAQSLKAGKRVTLKPGATSICDALLAPSPGEITFAINRTRLAGGLVVTDDEVLDAIAYAFRNLKLVIEPGGAVPLAAILSGKLAAAGRTTVVVCSGGNVDPATFKTALDRVTA
ncbi:MAG: threonine/serine dehydratase [Alphaproteobacteria bacterium]|nr:threonine/serine dehydratase [Alphaproteobacteria bacterium]